MTRWLPLAALALSACTAHPPKPDLEALAREVTAAERAFAATMANRDLAAFTTFLSEETVFFSGKEVLRGRQQVTDGWRRFFEKPGAPFSWEPAQVQVLESGTLALSTGPVHLPSGKQVATFSSIWRLEAPGTWRVIFDKGCDVCDCGR